MTFVRPLGVVFVASLLQGCVTPIEIDAAHDTEKRCVGSVSTVESQNFLLGTIKNNKLSRIVVGQKGADEDINQVPVYLSEPSTNAVLAAVRRSLEDNGHTIGASRIRVDGELEEFWVSKDTGWLEVRYICLIDVRLNFVDTESGKDLYSNRYVASYLRSPKNKQDSPYADAVNGALDALVDEVVFDTELVAALKQ